MVECKLSDRGAGANIVYFSRRYSLAATHLARSLRTDHRAGDIEIRSAEAWLAGLFL